MAEGLSDMMALTWSYLEVKLIQTGNANYVKHQKYFNRTQQFVLEGSKILFFNLTIS